MTAPDTAPIDELFAIVRDLVRPLTLNEVAVLLDLHPKTVGKQWRNGKIPPPMNSHQGHRYRWAPGPLRSIVVEGVPYAPKVDELSARRSAS